MKRILCVLLVLCIFLITACSYKSESKIQVNVNEENVVDAKTTFDTNSNKPLDVEISTGGFAKVDFGRQNGKPVTWLVISEDDEGKILLSENILDVKKYNEKYEKIDWDKTTLYEYLNSDFVNEYFSKEERDQMIFTNDVDNDLVTMLSINNLLDLYGDMNYMKDGYYGDPNFFEANKNIVAKPEELAIYNEIDVFDNETMAQIMRTDIDNRYDFANGCAGYWILNQVDDTPNAFLVSATGYIDNMPIDTDYIGIRPVIRIKGE